MPPIYIVHQNAKIRIKNRRIQVVELTNGTENQLASAPLGQVSQIVLFGNISLTTPVITACLNKQIDVVFLSVRGEYRGQLSTGITPHVPLRRAQYHFISQPNQVLTMAKAVVKAKLQHQAAMLKRHRTESQNLEILVSALTRIQQSLALVDRKISLASLRGVEGSASAAYFSGYRTLFSPAWRFEKRLRRPPPDPVNVLLSLGYTLLTNLATSAVQTVGLDPYAGFLHELVYNRPALGLDLVEEFRPVVDGIVLWSCRSGGLQPDQFEPGTGSLPILLNEAGKKQFLSAFESRMNLRFTHPIQQKQYPLRQCLIEQARQIANRIQNDQAGYTPMGFR